MLDAVVPLLCALVEPVGATMKIWTTLSCLALALTACKEAAPPKPIPERAPPPPVQEPAQEQPRKKYAGTRVGPVLAMVSIMDSILISGPKTRPGPPAMGGMPPLGPIPIPVQDEEGIVVTLSNDTDRDIDLEGNWPYLFRVSVTNSSGTEVFDKSRSTDALPRLSAGDVKEFEVIWPVRGLRLGDYTVTLRLGVGGKLTRRTLLY